MERRVLYTEELLRAEIDALRAQYQKVAGDHRQLARGLDRVRETMIEMHGIFTSPDHGNELRRALSESHDHLEREKKDAMAYLQDTSFYLEIAEKKLDLAKVEQKRRER